MAAGEMADGSTVARWNDTGLDPAAPARPVIALLGCLALVGTGLAFNYPAFIWFYGACGLLAAGWLVWLLLRQHTPIAMTLELEPDRLRLTRNGHSTEIPRADIAVAQRLGSRQSFSGVGSGVRLLDATGRELLRLRRAWVTASGPLAPARETPFGIRRGFHLDDLVGRWWSAATQAERAATLTRTRRLDADPQDVRSGAFLWFGIGLAVMVGGRSTAR